MLDGGSEGSCPPLPRRLCPALGGLLRVHESPIELNVEKIQAALDGSLAAALGCKRGQHCRNAE